jgi:hypothetical protein
MGTSKRRKTMMTEMTKIDLYNIAQDWYEANQIYSEDALDFCMALYSDVNWTEDAMEFLLDEIAMLHNLSN